MTTYDTQNLVPWLEPVTFTQVASPPVVTSNVQAGVTQITLREAAQSGGASLVGDITVEIAANALATVPGPKDTVLWGGATYVVMSVGGDPTWLKFYSLACRNPSIAFDLQDLATLTRYTSLPNASGIRETTATVIGSNVSCRLQSEGNLAEQDTGGKLTTRKRYLCYLGTAYELLAGDTITVNSVLYEVTGQSDIQALGMLTVVRCERVD